MISTLVLSGTQIYIAGSFDRINDRYRSGLAALDTSTGTLTDWNPNPIDSVQTIALSGARAYIGGDFRLVGGQLNPYFAIVDDRPLLNKVYLAIGYASKTVIQ